MAKHAVIIDYSNFFYQCLFRAVQAPEEYNVLQSAVFMAEGKIRTIRRFVENLKIEEYEIVFAEDRIPVRKLQVYPQYKGTRSDKSEEELSIKEGLKQHLIYSGYGGKFCYSIGNEADDVIATLVRLCNKREDMLSLIVSMDRDMWQLLGPRTTIYDNRRKALVTPENVEQAFGTASHQICLVKSLWGDSGDNVPNAVPRMQKQILPLVRQTEDGELETFKQNIVANWSSLTPKCQTLYSKGEAQVAVNYSLVKLDDRCPLSWD